MLNKGKGNNKRPFDKLRVTNQHDGRNNEYRTRINEVRNKINNKSRVGNIEIASPAGSGFAMTEGRMNVE